MKRSWHGATVLLCLQYLFQLSFLLQRVLHPFLSGSLFPPMKFSFLKGHQGPTNHIQEARSCTNVVMQRPSGLFGATIDGSLKKLHLSNCDSRNKAQVRTARVGVQHSGTTIPTDTTLACQLCFLNTFWLNRN